MPDNPNEKQNDKNTLEDAFKNLKDKLTELSSELHRYYLLGTDAGKIAERKRLTSKFSTQGGLKGVLYQKGIKQVDLVRQLDIDPSRLSHQINGVRPLPEKYQKRLAELLGL